MRQVRVNTLYQGAPSGEKPILPGVYNEDDPRLFDLADYLIGTIGCAEVVGEVATLPASPTEPTSIMPPTPNDGGEPDEGTFKPPSPEVIRAMLEKKYDAEKLDDLDKQVKERALQIVPTGKTGGIVKADLVKALVDADLVAASNDQGDSQDS